MPAISFSHPCSTPAGTIIGGWLALHVICFKVSLINPLKAKGIIIDMTHCSHDIVISHVVLFKAC